MIKILIPMETFSGDKFKLFPVYGAFASYVQKLINRNLLPLFVSPSMTPEGIDDLYQIADGIHFMGGADIDPKYYNQIKHEKTSANENLRDKMELEILKKTLKDRKPFLGICRGCQTLAVASGGTLVQHVPDIVGHTNHSLKNDQPYDALATRDKHPIIIDKTSRIYQLLGKEKIMTNSGHHQAAATVGKDFRITGKSEDGIAEVIEHIDPEYFCFAVQPHPEAEENGDLEKLFTEFANAAKEYSLKRN